MIHASPPENSVMPPFERETIVFSIGTSPISRQMPFKRSAFPYRRTGKPNFTVFPKVARTIPFDKRGIQMDTLDTSFTEISWSK
jgi:hypothetical protein